MDTETQQTQGEEQPSVTEQQPDETVLTGEQTATSGKPVEGDAAPAGVTDAGETAPEGDGAGESGPGAPDEYGEFTVPEGFEFDEAQLGQLHSMFKRMNLSQEDAQKMVDDHIRAVNDRNEAYQAERKQAFVDMTTEWLNSAKADKEIGGDAFDESVSSALLVIDKVGTPEFKQLLRETGIGNHPELIRVLSRVGRLMKEDSPGASGGVVNNRELSVVERMYGAQE